ncbi:hypothetical protein F5Y03DRAFT_403612 [Xylaria venustula]|nr:hypothetical protein F5Y03DRAFT_403612 [Xylaria venustula]
MAGVYMLQLSIAHLMSECGDIFYNRLDLSSTLGGLGDGTARICFEARLTLWQHQAGVGSHNAIAFADNKVANICYTTSDNRVGRPQNANSSHRVAGQTSYTTHPHARLSTAPEDLYLRVAVTSSAHSGRLAFVEDLEVFSIDASSFRPLRDTLDFYIRHSGSHKAAYAMFTSGSTGNLEGFVVEYDLYYADAQARPPVLGRGESSRVLQFASHAFDPIIEDIMTSLTFGGCVCILSTDASLLKLWEESIQRDLGRVSASAAFFGYGGDSLAAIRLSLARRKRLQPTAATIHRNLILKDMAQWISFSPVTHTLFTFQPSSFVSHMESQTNFA